MNKKFAALLVLSALLPISCGDNQQSSLNEPPPAPPGAQRPAQQPLVRDQDAGRTGQPTPAESEGRVQMIKSASDTAGAVDAQTVLLHPVAKLEAARQSLAEKSYGAAPHHDYAATAHTQQVWNRESYDAVAENRFINSRNDPLSTFSIDVDTASYANVRRFIQGGSLPPGGAVRAEEMINYFKYMDPEPMDGKPFALRAEAGPSPFHEGYRLLRIGLKARDLDPVQRPASNLVFLIDVSGSMNQPNKLPLLKQSLKLLVEQLNERDRVSVVVYAGSDRVVLSPTPGSEHDTISQAIEHLHSGGSTHGSKGILTAYELAKRCYMPEGNNRVILVSDGDFNVGVTSRSELQKLIEDQRTSGIYLSVLGFGDGNFQDDTMELLADKGNGNYAYIDSLLEAKKVLLKEFSGTLFTLANDVKIQVEFNPNLVGAYRLIGYENRALEDEDFKDDAKDAGEIGMGHQVTALYELIPTGHPDIPQVDQLKYQAAVPQPETVENELLTVKLRYKPRSTAASTQISVAVTDSQNQLSGLSNDFRFAAAVAGFAMLLKESEHLGNFSWDGCLDLARGARGADEQGYRAEFIRLVEMGQLLKKSS
ncbi:MAG: VWA domain-containing protein [Desulfocapsaceae bacterium]